MPVSGAVHVPVCVEAFGYASPRDAEMRLRTGVSQPWESGHLLHLPPAELLQCIPTHFHQGRSEQIPHRSANKGQDVSAVMKVK